MRVTFIDKDRTRRGDYFKKPTAYWFVNCKNTYGESYQPTPKKKIKTITAGSGALKTKKKSKETMTKEALSMSFIGHKSETGICDKDRSMISSDYARNFICDFLLGKVQNYTQMSLF